MHDRRAEAAAFATISQKRMQQKVRPQTSWLCDASQSFIDAQTRSSTLDPTAKRPNIAPTIQKERYPRLNAGHASHDWVRHRSRIEAGAKNRPVALSLARKAGYPDRRRQSAFDPVIFWVRCGGRRKRAQFSGRELGLASPFDSRHDFSR
jgi:hypothetical protein